MIGGCEASKQIRTENEDYSVECSRAKILKESKRGGQKAGMLGSQKAGKLQGRNINSTLNL